MKYCSSTFRQSLNDFPCSIELGKKIPSFGINRWGNNALRFVPYDDEGFAVRGDKKWLLYKGRRRSHRFTILNDGAFEYDCILLREPESNIISLRIEGAENYNFFRQPDFVPDDFLKGSYAVYKKETLVGQGTGKLCHIHRPLIIDALGRKVWGELSVTRNELRLTIPEQWLSQAKYPVTVDPTIGTTTIGKQNYWEDNEGDLYIEMGMIVNRFLVSDALSGTSCTAYFYTDQHDGSGGGRAILYSDNANSPLTKRSTNENFINLDFYSGNNKGWRSGTFNANSVTAGSYVWFGLHSEYMWYPRYDFGARCYWSSWEEYPNKPNTFPLWSVSDYYDYKLSMYFNYTVVSAQNYVRTLTQGLNLSDSLKKSSEYKRTSSQTAQVNDTKYLKAEYKRDVSENVNASASTNALFTFFRLCLETVGNSIGFSRLPFFNRFVNDDINANSTIKGSREINRKCDDVIGISDNANRSQGFIRAITENILTNDYFDFSVLFVRNLQDTQTVTDTFHQIRDFIRFLFEEAASMAETNRNGDFYRTEKDIVNVDGFSFRHLLIFIKLVSACFIRDFLLRRFLIAREELVLKSKISLELSIESKIN